MYPSQTQTPGASMGAATPSGNESNKPTEMPATTGSAPSIASTSTSGVEGY
jgi:hypothetical protein